MDVHFITKLTSSSYCLLPPPPCFLTGPSAPRNVTVRLIAPLLVEIRWRQPAVSNGQIIHYTVYAIPIVVPAITKRQAASNPPNGTIKQVCLHMHVYTDFILEHAAHLLHP